LRGAAAALLLALLVAGSPGSVRSGTASVPTQWLSYGHDAQLTNHVSMPSLTPAKARKLAVVWQKRLDGPLVASPLYANGSLFVATEAGSVYALRPSDGAVRWKRAFGAVSTELCGNWGISSTGAIDLKRRVLYVIGADGYVHALGLTSGRERRGWPVAVTAEHRDGEYVWGGLRLLKRTLYVPVASYCDVPGSDGHLANGRLVGIDVDRHAIRATFDPVAGDENLGGIWGWGGVSVGPAGQALFTGIGNSHVYEPSCDCYLEKAGFGNAMVKLSTDLRPLASNRPMPDLPDGDFDLGTSPLLFQPSGCPPLAAGNSKIGYLFVWNRQHLDRGPLYLDAVSDGIASFVGQPSYSPTLRTIFEAHSTVQHNGTKVGDGIGAYTIDSKCRFRRIWVTSVGAGQEPAPLVAGNIVFAPGGDRGGFTALDARTGKYLWRLKTVQATISPPMAAGGRIFAGDYGGTLRAFAPR
jgi:outer membrane protein assembly factor BamB